MVEIPLPWKYSVLESNGVPPGLHDLVQGLYAQQVYPAMVGLAPDEAYAVAGMTRIVDYRVPAAPFAGYGQREYLIPTDQVADVLQPTLVDQPNPGLEQFAVASVPGQRDIYVCTHGAIDACCAKFGYPLYKLLRHMADNPDYHLRVWRCTHFGGHRFAGTMLDMPQGRYWGHLSAQDLGPIVRRTGDVELIRKRYRGWAALPYGAAQVAEGELFRRGGWNWLECAVSPGETPPFDWDNPALPEQTVTFDFRHAGRGIDGSVDVLVRPDGFIQTMETSKSEHLTDAPQYATSIVSESATQGFFDRE
jgi:hypothetical protein